MQPDDPNEGSWGRSAAALAIVKRLEESPEEREYELLTSHDRQSWLAVDQGW